MNREEIKKILGEGASEEQITALLNFYHSNNKKIVDELNLAKTQLGKYSDYDNIKSKLDEIEREKLTEQQKIDLANQEAQETLAKANKIYFTAKAKEILAGLETDEDIISTLVGKTEEETISNATRLANRYKNIREDAEKKTRETLATADIKPNIEEKTGEEAMNIGKFLQLSSEEQEKFIAEHPTEFNNL